MSVSRQRTFAISAPALAREARRRAGLTQAAVARRAGTTQSAVARLEADGANPRIETLGRVLDATGHRLELTAAPAAGDVDLSQIAEHVRLSSEERLRSFTASYRNFRELMDKTTTRGNLA